MAPQYPDASLLGLPGELRDDILSYVTSDERIIRIKKGCYTQPRASTTDRLTCRAPLILACKQLHQEYKDTLKRGLFATRNATELQGRITSKEKRSADAIVAFCETLSEKEWDAVVEGQKLVIKLIHRQDCLRQLVEADAQPWLRYCKSTGMAATYVIGGPRRDRLHWPAREMIQNIRNTDNNEVDKIMSALSEWELRVCDYARDRAYEQQRAAWMRDAEILSSDQQARRMQLACAKPWLDFSFAWERKISVEREVKERRRNKDEGIALT